MVRVENDKFVQHMRIPEDASDARIQQILSNMISKDQFCPSLDSRSSPSSVQSSVRDESKTETETRDCKLLVYRSSVQLDNSFKQRPWIT